MNTVGISSNALFGNSANNFFDLTFLLIQYFYQHSIFSADYHFVFVLQKLRKRLTLTSILARGKYTVSGKKRPLNMSK